MEVIERACKKDRNEVEKKSECERKSQRGKRNLAENEQSKVHVCSFSDQNSILLFVQA